MRRARRRAARGAGIMACPERQGTWLVPLPSRRRQVNIFWRKAEALTWTLLAFNMAYRGALQQHVDEDMDGEAAMRLQECGGVIGAMNARPPNYLRYLNP